MDETKKNMSLKIEKNNQANSRESPKPELIFKIRNS
jgi:hypothetical protein